MLLAVTEAIATAKVGDVHKVGFVVAAEHKVSRVESIPMFEAFDGNISPPRALLWHAGDVCAAIIVGGLVVVLAFNVNAGHCNVDSNIDSLIF